MAETADTPEPYISDDAPRGTESALHAELDPLVNPEEAGEGNPGTRPGSRSLRKQRWNTLTEMFADLKSACKEEETVVGLEMGYIIPVGKHPIASLSRSVIRRTQ